MTFQSVFIQLNMKKSFWHLNKERVPSTRLECTAPMSIRRDEHEITANERQKNNLKREKTRKAEITYSYFSFIYKMTHAEANSNVIWGLDECVWERAYMFATVTWQSVIINRVERAHFILMSMEIGNQQPFLRLHTVLGVRSCIDLLYRLQLSLPFIRVYALCHSNLLQSLHLTMLASYTRFTIW